MSEQDFLTTGQYHRLRLGEGGRDRPAGIHTVVEFVHPYDLVL